MLLIDLDDNILKKAKVDKITKNTKVVTTIALYSGLIAMVGTGVIGLPVVVNCVIIGCISKATRVVVKKTGLFKMIRRNKTSIA